MNILDGIPMLRRLQCVGRNKPKESLRAKQEGWSAEERSHRDPCPDCRGWISLNYEHDNDCIRLVPWRERNRRHNTPKGDQE